MLDQSAFLDTVLHAPDDDGPRLVYADWLEERGETARAELIRVQLELAAMPAGPLRCVVGKKAFKQCRWRTCQRCRRHRLRGRVKELLRQHQQAWSGPVWDATPAGAEHVTWERGFVGVVRLPARNLVQRADLILQAQPVREFLTTDGGQRVVVRWNRADGAWGVGVSGDLGPGPAERMFPDRPSMLIDLRGFLRIHLQTSVYVNVGSYAAPRYAHLLERGTVRRRPTPFVIPPGQVEFVGEDEAPGGGRSLSFRVRPAGGS